MVVIPVGASGDLDPGNMCRGDRRGWRLAQPNSEPLYSEADMPPSTASTLPVM